MPNSSGGGRFQAFKEWFWKTELFLRLSVGFFAGGLGGLASGIVSVPLYYSGLPKALNTTYVSDADSADWWGLKILFGSLWGFLFLIPAGKRVPFLFRGVMASIILAFFYYLVSLPLLIEDPHHSDHSEGPEYNKAGLFGKYFGKWYWLFVLIETTAWGLLGVS